MRAFYSTQKHFRAFIFGTLEGWQVSIYDLQKHERVEKNVWIEDSLKGGQGHGARKDLVIARQNSPVVEVALVRRTHRSGSARKPLTTSNLQIGQIDPILEGRRCM